MPALLAISAMQIALLAMLVAITTIVMILTRNRVRDSVQSPRPSARARYAQLSEKRRALREVEEVMIELDQVARNVHGQLDTRFAKLEAVIRDADERIAELKRLTRKTEAAPSLDITLDAVEPDEEEAAPVMGDGPHADVYRLADAGMDRIRIAEETGKKTGEIELILALRKARPARTSS